MRKLRQRTLITMPQIMQSVSNSEQSGFKDPASNHDSDYLSGPPWNNLHAQSCLTLRPNELQPPRLLCPWDSPGKNTGVGCHFLPKGIFPIHGSNCISCIGRPIIYHLALHNLSEFLMLWCSLWIFTEPSIWKRYLTLFVLNHGITCFDIFKEETMSIFFLIKKLVRNKPK